MYFNTNAVFSFVVVVCCFLFFSQYSSLMMSCLAAMLFRFGYARREVKVKRQRNVYTSFLFDFRFGLNVFEHRHLRTHTKSTFDHCVQEWRIFSRLIGFIKKLNQKKNKIYRGDQGVDLFSVTHTTISSMSFDHFLFQAWRANSFIAIRLSLSICCSRCHRATASKNLISTRKMLTHDRCVGNEYWNLGELLLLFSVCCICIQLVRRRARERNDNNCHQRLFIQKIL